MNGIRKSKRKSKWISLDEAVRETMRVKGVTEKEAEAMLLKALQKGELTAWARAWDGPSELPD